MQTKGPAKRKIAVVFLCLVFCILAVFVVPVDRLEPPKTSPPNVVLIILDALRFDRLHAVRGSLPLMPYLSEFSSHSKEFTHAITPCTWTKPAMASILTSLYVDVHQVYFTADPKDESATVDVLSPHFQTIAAYLKDHGYDTLGVQTNPNLTQAVGFSQGFDIYVFENDAPATWTTQTAISHLQSLSRPFFAYIHYMDPHLPYEPPQFYRDLLDVPTNLDPNDQYWLDHFTDCFFDQVYHFTGMSDSRSFPDPSEQGKDAIRTLYDAEVRFLDDQLSCLLTYLQESSPNTYIVILADHGEEFWDHGSLGHGATMYDELLRVPFLLYGPDINPEQITTPVETLDILPTIAALLHLRRNPTWQGHDLLDPARPPIRPAFSTTRAAWPRVNLHLEQVTYANHKLILRHKKQRYELYNLINDPAERLNLYPPTPDHQPNLHTLLQEHSTQNNQHRQHFSPTTDTQLDPESLEQLNAVGYTGPSHTNP